MFSSFTGTDVWAGGWGLSRSQWLYATNGNPTHCEGVAMSRIPKIAAVVAALGIILCGGAGTAAAQDDDDNLVVSDEVFPDDEIPVQDIIAPDDFLGEEENSSQDNMLSGSSS